MRRRSLLTAAPAALLIAGCSAQDGSGSGAGGAGGSEDSASAPASPEPETPEQSARRQADALDLRAAAGQLVLAGVPAGTSPAPALGSETRVGGYFLLGRWTSAGAVRDVVAATREAVGTGVAPLMTVDQEGGQIRVLRGDAARDTPSAETLGADGPEAVRSAYRTIGEDLAALGLHADLAPVADVVSGQLGSANAPVGQLDRGFGTDPDAVGPCVVAAVEGLAASGIASALKHFPGLGRVEANTDFSASGITDADTHAEDPFLDPFRAGIDAGAEMVMLSSAVYPRIEEGVPAMFSPALVTGLLREDWGFEGLVITDDIGAAAAVADVPLGERATRLLEAGGDCVLTADPDLAEGLVSAIVEWAEAGNEARVRESAARMLALKIHRGVLAA
ncbi:glycoside hydrolase family 3 protein [Brachybacterium sp. JHP9]|uniref:Glycoside hydrolase family 3 protein n=1 Tax=Brachybacterium equifaecis TaxID=2910770 RepID=A0ABT0R0M4_9MICO|nr:glycoside hydrolase family 3 N-terminal domain-containing protein [Brachybacterium equifaecis]MCL6422993.1 glycoside hydrolase family 3 protein [Brachybacterium equifaecis]